jgi:uncharacterized DUF497 family protein
MRIDYDPVKREATIVARGLDMAMADRIFAGPHLTFDDDRRDYGERREITVGFLEGRLVFVVWTRRGDARRIISMRKANEREKTEYGPLIAELGRG